MSFRADKIAVVGDLHGHYNELDNHYFEQAGYEFVIFLGDLGSGTRESERRVIGHIANLRVRSLILLGNNDSELLTELNEGLLRSGISPSDPIATVGGYSSHLLRAAGGDITIICGRPFATGGSEFSFGNKVEQEFGVTGLEHSCGRLRRLVDDAPSKALIFVGHNGPYGLGGEGGAPWARDFTLPFGMEETMPRDWGDSDFAEAIAYAEDQGKDVLLVIAGHMHRSPLEKQRSLSRTVGSTSYVNAAMVPRIVSDSREESHHFVDIDLNRSAQKGLRIRELWEPLRQWQDSFARCIGP